MADKIVKRGISIFIDGKEITNSVKSIRGEMQKLVNEQAKMTVGADDYVAHAKKIAYLDSLLKEHRENQKKIADGYDNVNKKSQSWFQSAKSGIGSLADGFNKYLGIVTAVLASITGLTLGLKKFMDMRMEVEDASANLKSLTNLGDEDIKWLRQYAKELSTTTTEAGIRITATSKEILDGFTVIGSKRPELLKNKEAMAEVTKEALTLAESGVPVEQAFEVVTASMNQFNLKGKDASRIINTIAAGSLEGSAEADSLAGSLKNVGTVANDSNMSLEDTVAMLEVMASKQLTGEEAGTKLRGALLKLKEAGVGYASGQFNVRDALVEVNKKLSEHGSAAQRDAALQKIFGAENVTAGTILLQNVEAYDKMRVAVTGTNTAYDQAIIRTKTTSALLAQARNKFSEMGMELVENLNPAMLKATNIGNGFLKFMIQMPSWIAENKGVLITLATTTISYIAVVNAWKIAERAKRIEELISIATTKGRIIADLALCAVQETLAGNFKTARKAMAALNKELIVNPWIALGVVVAAVSVAIYTYATRTTDVQKAMREFNREAATQKRELNDIFEAYKKANPKTEEKARLLKLIKEKYGPYIKDLIDEKGHITDIEKAQRQANKALTESIALKIKNKYIDEYTSKEIENQAEIMTNIRERIKDSKGESLANLIVGEIGDTMTKNINDPLTKGLPAIQKILARYGLMSGVFDRREFGAMTASLASSYYHINKKTEEFNAVFKGLVGSAGKVADAADGTGGDGGNGGGNAPSGGSGVSDKDKKYAADLKKKEKYWKDDEEVNKRAYAEEKIGEDAFHEWMFQNKMGALQDKLNLQKKYGKETIDTEIEIQDALISENEYWNNKEKKQTEKKNDDIVKSEDDKLRRIKDFMQKYNIDEQFGMDEVARFKAQKELELEILQDFLAKGILSEKDAALVRQQLLAEEFDLRTKNIRASAQVMAGIASDLSGTMQGFQSAEESAVDLKYKKQIDAAKRAGKDTTKLEEKKEKELGAIRAKWADKIFVVQVAGIIASTAAAAIDAYANAIKIPGVGLALAPIAAGAAVAYGASQVAQANAARKQAKAGYYSGGWNNNPSGFTGGTDPREVRGYFPNGEPYHGGEFITDHVTTANPEVVPLLNLFDAAQKNGTAGSITRKDMAKALRLDSGGYYSGGWVATMGGGSAAGNASGTGADDELRYQLTRLNDHLDAGISAPIFLHGDSGMVKKLKEYETLLNNSKR